MTGVVISEVVANPMGRDTEGEFIELLNQGNERINLTGWKITDEQGKGFNLTGYQIEAGGRLLLEYKQTKITLNNQGETVTLWQGGEKIDEIKIPIATEGTSWSRKGDVWQITEVSTPGEENILPESEIQRSDFAGQEINQGGMVSVILAGVVISLLLAGIGSWIINKINFIQ